MRPDVLLIGAGGLGCPAAFALAAAGVKHLGVVDDDVVDEINLHRQVLHGIHSLGEPKVVSLALALAARFPGIRVEPFRARFDTTNARDLLGDHDVLVDGSDNLATKFLANDAAVLCGKPLVHAAALGLRGQLVTVPAGGRPCYRCLFEELPAAGVVASCAEVGILGPVPGVLGAVQAAEAVRLLRGETPAFVGRLVHYDAAAMSARTIRYKPNPTCAVCGTEPRITELRPEAYEAARCTAANT